MADQIHHVHIFMQYETKYETGDDGVALAPDVAAVLGRRD